MLSALGSWLLAFALTQAFELPVYFWPTRGFRVGFFASAITHPLVWFVFPLLMTLGVPYWPMVALAELFAVGAEALWLHANGVRRPLAWSLAANTVSASLGLLLRASFGWP